jgi:hypothetical protein
MVALVNKFYFLASFYSRTKKVKCTSTRLTSLYHLLLSFTTDIVSFYSLSFVNKITKKDLEIVLVDQNFCTNKFDMKTF